MTEAATPTPTAPATDAVKVFPPTPGLDSLAKSFEPAAIERHWGPLWEQSGQYEPTLDARQALVRHPAAAAQRDRHAAHGPCVQPDHHGLADALPPHARRQHAVGAGHRPRRHCHADRGGAPAAGARRPDPPRPGRARTSSPRSGSGRKSPATPSPRQMRRMGDSVDWRREYFTMDPKTVQGRHRDLRAAVRAGPDLPRQAPGELGPDAANPPCRDLEVESEEEDGFMWHIRYPLADGSRLA